MTLVPGRLDGELVYLIRSSIEVLRRHTAVKGREKSTATQKSVAVYRFWWSSSNPARHHQLLLLRLIEQQALDTAR